ncbi:hypothetical protein DVH24_010550 [Malus domestica]|uniref:Uncharacterized protein n=1 Tax=Malus domestica TaxID=3750 RepID=A0A498JSP8_MALDO|nr:hypothetical protein DVH24_010550 [Malus domestica]
MGVRLADIHLSQTLNIAGALCTGYDYCPAPGSSILNANIPVSDIGMQITGNLDWCLRFR